MLVTAALLGEHGALYAQFDHLERLAAEATIDDIRAYAGVLAAAVATHARLEDDLLFAALEPELGPAGPLLQMRREHDEIEAGLECLVHTADPAAGNALRDVIRLARAHFAKEEGVLFPMAAGLLAHTTLERLGAEWAVRRGVLLA
ncbi:hypothetical protein DCC79_01390 [bacterium]|nr:hemerythrin domain-containing protein [Chloroflexi bacterium CFX6]RIL12461.1 MAG: hypothetical protein DCC79_01390 [bacterium]